MTDAELAKIDAYQNQQRGMISDNTDRRDRYWARHSNGRRAVLC